MSRFVNRKQLSVSQETLPVTQVSQEGFFGALGKFIAKTGAAYVRSTTLGMIDWSREYRPELNGMPQTNFQQLSVSIGNAVKSGGVWDLVIRAGFTDFQMDGAVESYSYLVLIGEGDNVRVRLPGYNEGDYSAKVALLLLNEFKLKQIQ